MKLHQGRVTLAAALAWTVVVVCGPARGSTIRHDKDIQDYVDYGDGIRLVGGVNNALQSFGSGVLIHPEWVLTAAHVVYPVSPFGISFETDPDPDEVVDPDFGLPVSGFFYVTEIAVHEYYDDSIGPAGGFDIALLHLDRPLTWYTPYDRYQSSNVVGKQGTYAGFGATGDGITGYDLNTGGFARIAGDNMIDGIANDPRVIDEFVSRSIFDPVLGTTVEFTQEEIASQFMMSDFDAPEGTTGYTNPLGDSTSLDFEGSVAPGDSGGPIFVQGASGLEVAGINSWILGLESPEGDGTDNATYSDLQGYLRIAQFNSWIDDVIGIPEPGTALSVLAFGLIVMRRRRQ